MRQRSLKWVIVQILADAVLINLSTLLAWFIRYELEIAPVLGEGFFYQPFISYLPFALVLTAFSIAIFRFEGLYARSRERTLSEEFYTLFNGTTTAILLIMAFTFFLRPLAFSRAMYLYAAFITIVLLCLARVINRIVQAHLRKRGIGVDRVLIVGAGEVGRTLMRNLIANPDLAYQVVGFVDDDPEKARNDIGRFKALGGTSNLPALIREQSANEIIVTLPWTARGKIIQIMNLSRHTGVVVKIVPDLFQLSLSRVAIDNVGGIPLIAVRELQMGMVDSALKRSIDLIGSGLFLVFFAPVMALLSLLIRLDSPGPAIFSQKRVGRFGRSFDVYKFRSMRVGAEEELAKLNELNEATGPIFKMRNDPRLTRFGRWLRRMSLDELPQFWNVLRGEMSLVGPRPALPSEVEQYQEWHKRRLEVSPGMTGLWQVSGRSELTFDEMVMLDIYYIENWTPWMDIGIVLRTIPTVLFAQGAY
jgi:exopolysaccharide biosynthesis polyprenyl glycosylphosphotransferase